MSKYIKLEDAIDVLYSGFVTKNYIEKKIKDLPTIEFSEDAISREDLIKSFLADCECESREEAEAATLKLEDMLELIEDAPSVVPSARPIEMHLDVTDDVVDRAAEQIRAESEDCISREYLKSFGYINKGDFNSVETIREWIDNAPSVIPKERSE